MEKKSYLCSMEKWKYIIGYEGLYQVSNYGRVKSCNTKLKRERILKQQFRDDNGYAHLLLSKNSKVTRFLVHRLVAQSFLQNPNEYPLVMHVDGNRQNNNVLNLQWGTHKMNNNQTINEGKSANQYGKYTWRTN